MASGYDSSMDRATRNREWFGRTETANIFDLATALDDSPRIDGRDLTRDDLYRIGDEIGLSPAAIDAAIDETRRRQRSMDKETRRAARRRLRFIRHVMAFTIVVGVLAVVDTIDGGGWWSIYIAGIWGIALALYGLRFFTRRNGPLERWITGT
jgi:hypothetical protein